MTDVVPIRHHPKCGVRHAPVSDSVAQCASCGGTRDTKPLDETQTAADVPPDDPGTDPTVLAEQVEQLKAQLEAERDGRDLLVRQGEELEQEANRLRQELSQAQNDARSRQKTNEQLQRELGEARERLLAGTPMQPPPPADPAPPQ